jgi:dimethylamine/trimethylamine dehydrogenase
MDVEHVLAVEANHIVIATGASWLTNGRGLYNKTPLYELGPPEQVFTPDDIMAGRLPQGPTLIYDDDHYYMGNVIAELLRSKDIPVTLVTPEVMVSTWGDSTGEHGRVQRRMMELEVDAVVTVTIRSPNDTLFHELQQSLEAGTDYKPDSLTRIGDCLTPTIIAGAVFSGHRYARELDTEVDPDNRMKYDRVFFDDE